MAKKMSKNKNFNVELLHDEIKFLQNLLKTKDTQIEELETNIQMQNQYVERLETDYKFTSLESGITKTINWYKANV